MRIYYKSGYKYQLNGSITYSLLGNWNGCNTGNSFVYLKDNILNIKNGYAWDGASGPAIDTRNIMRASLIHDALYQLMREDMIPRSARKLADKELYNLCKLDGMSRFRAGYVYFFVRLFGSLFIKPRLNELKVAP